MVFTKKDEDMNVNKRIKKSKVKFYDTIFDDEDEFVITLQKTEDGHYELQDQIEIEEEEPQIVESEDAEEVAESEFKDQDEEKSI